MKIRNGFVSNSSSSSFVVAFPRPVKSAEDIMDMVFHNEPKYHEYDTDHIAEILAADCLAQTPNNLAEMSKQLNGGTLDFPYLADYIDEDGKIKWDEFKADAEGTFTQPAKDFMEEFPNTYAYVFHFADEDGPFWGEMEHGGLFKYLDGQRISHH